MTNTPTLIQVGPGLAAHIQDSLDETAETILWLHGYTMDGSVWSDLWSHLPEFRHIGLDLPGHGNSAPLTPDATLPDIGRSIVSVAREHGARRLVAISFGGMMALQAAIEAPDQFDAIVLGSPSLGGGPQDAVAGRKHMELAINYALRGPGPWMTKLWMQWPPDIFKGARAHASLWSHLEHVIDNHTWAELKHRALITIAQHAQTAEALRAIQADVLLVLGEHDMPTFVDIAACISSTLASAHVQSITDAGHLAMLESHNIASALIKEHLVGLRTS